MTKRLCMGDDRSLLQEAHESSWHAGFSILVYMLLGLTVSKANVLKSPEGLRNNQQQGLADSKAPCQDRLLVEVSFQASPEGQ